METKYILYADDDADDREMMEEMFVSNTSITLLTFNDGHHLVNHLDQVSKENICLVVLDMNMPLLDGIATLTRIRQDNALTKLPVIIYTTSGSPVDKTRATNLDAEVITKPVSHTELKELASRMMAHCAKHLPSGS